MGDLVAGKTVVPHGINTWHGYWAIRGIAKEYSIKATINLPHAADRISLYGDSLR